MILRNLMLRAAEDPTLVRLVAGVSKRYGLAGRFIAGESLGEALEVVRALNAEDIPVTLDQLGEGVLKDEEARLATLAYRDLLRGIHENGVRSSISIKLTQLGLDIDRGLCSANLSLILDEARKLDNFVRIDMESSVYTQATVELFRQHFETYGRHVGIVIQSYLYRSEADVRELSALGCSIRLCKGAYMEPGEVAFPSKRDVDNNFRKLLEIMFSSNCYCAIATHDLRLIEFSREYVSKHGIPDSRFEFQMLYGVRRELQKQLRRRGYKMRVYVPFGVHWAPYFMRRLAERPANLLFIARNLFRS